MTTESNKICNQTVKVSDWSVIGFDNDISETISFQIYAR